MFWAKQTLLAIDQLFNAIFLGWADESFSARCWRCRNIQPFKTMRFVVDCLFFFDKNHCKSSFQSERLRLHSPPEERL